MRVLVSEFMSLDGVMQAPGGKEEDTSGGFRHGGWSFEFFDPEVMGEVIDGIGQRSEVLLQGRRTYQVSAEALPERGGDPFSDWINVVGSGTGPVGDPTRVETSPCGGPIAGLRSTRNVRQERRSPCTHE